MAYISKCSGHGIVELVKDRDSICGLEIGCAGGNTTEWLLKSLPQLQWHGIDPYMNYVDWNSNILNDLDHWYDVFSQRILQKFPDRTTLHRTTSDDAVKFFENESLDFIFIDGIHTYEQVLKDCINYYPKVKQGGLFAGHDYGVIKEVRDAVETFRNMYHPDKTILLTEVDVWYWWK